MQGWNVSLWFSVLAGMALKGSLVLCAAATVALVLRGRSAAVRHLLWTGTAAALLALPFLSASLPTLDVPAAGLLALDPGLVFQASARPQADAKGAAVTASHLQANRPLSRGWRFDPRSALVWIWLAGTSILFAQMLAAYLSVSRARRRARPFPGLGEGRPACPVLEAAPGSMPMAFGLRHPVIFLPVDAAAWSEERRRLVLLHESAHLRRGDTATHLMARAALALNWWNPLAWYGWRQFLKERERAADDLVLAAGARASDYAGHLLEVARSLESATATAWAAVAMARRSQLEGRLLSILDARTDRGTAGRRAAVAAALAAVLLIAPVAALRSQTRPEAAPQADNTMRFRTSTASPGSPANADAVAAEIDATIRAANAQKNYAILENAASAYEKQRLYDVAQQLLESALAIRADVSGTQSADYAAGLVKLGDLAQKRGRFEDAESVYGRAAALGDSPQTAAALLYLGRHAYGRRDRVKAADLLQRAINADPSGPQAGPALTWLAAVHQSERGGASEAEGLYLRALTAEDPASSEAATTMELYARFLRDQDRAAEADAMQARAREIRTARVKLVAAAAPRAGEVFRAGTGIAAPQLIHKVEPAYTEEARADKLAGTVLVYIEVGSDGLAHNVRVASGLGLGLDENAVEAISQWRFKPGMKDGQPVAVSATVEINFRLL